MDTCIYIHKYVYMCSYIRVRACVRVGSMVGRSTKSEYGAL
jgi:hypothetical protein